jgi:hypothetical protein
LENNPYKKSKQSSKIYSIKYKIGTGVSLIAAYHTLKNPALFASDILDSRKTNKVKVGINVNL